MHLSVIIPAYNERERLPPTLARLTAHLAAHHAPWEIVVVDDGRVVAECPLPVAGLLSDAPLAEVIEQSLATNEAAAALGFTVHRFY